MNYPIFFLSVIKTEYIWLLTVFSFFAIFVSFCQYCRKRKICRSVKILAWHKSRERISLIILSAIFICGGLGLLGITRHKEITYEEKRGADICFGLDITVSMLAPLTKGSPISRMQAMKKTLEYSLNFLENQKRQNRVTLVAFGWNAWILLPHPTSDFRLIRRRALNKINWRNSQLYGRQGSNLGAALIKGVLSFPKTDKGGEKRKKILIIMTDGEAYGNIADIQKKIAQAVSQYIQLKKITLILVGFGDPEQEVSIPKFDEYGNIIGKEINKRGQSVKTKADFTFLRNIAQRTNGGIFIKAGASAKTLNKRLHQAISDARKTGKIKKESKQEDITIYFVIIYGILLITWIALKNLKSKNNNNPL